MSKGKTYRRVLLSGHPGFIGQIEVMREPYGELMPCTRITSIGELSSNGKETSSRRVDLFLGARGIGIGRKI